MIMLNNLLENFVEKSRGILGENLVGIYLHGSAVMGCFSENKSDVDLLVVVNTEISDAVKRQYMDMVVELNAVAPSKGIELSIVRKEICNPFIYPTPFELHFSIAHLEWYRKNPEDYVAKMKGTDKDLAAHFTIIYHRGRCLFGEAINNVFENVGKEIYFDSIWNDVESAEEDILENPTYIILNLCRVLAYRKEELILSKQEGGKWGLEHIPEKYAGLIQQALDDYASVKPFALDETSALEYAKYMIGQIRGGSFLC